MSDEFDSGNAMEMTEAVEVRVDSPASPEMEMDAGMEEIGFNSTSSGSGSGASHSSTSRKIRKGNSLSSKDGLDISEFLLNKKFAENVELLSIPDVKMRVICCNLGIHKLRDLKYAQHVDLRILAMLFMDNTIEFMKSIGYKYVGELSFDEGGMPCPPNKKIWTINGERVQIMVGGLRFFTNSIDNIVFSCYPYREHSSVIVVYHKSESRAVNLISDLLKYTEKHNILRGIRLRSIDMVNGSFEEINIPEDYAWKNYYFQDSVKSLLELEVFGFLKKSEEYNKVGILKRGLMFTGPAGSGKTTLGKIICNYTKGFSFLWITPDVLKQNGYVQKSILWLYKLAKYLSPSIVFLEDLDLFASDRDISSDSLQLGALMNILDGVNTIENAITIATTNRIELVEKAISNRPGRFDRVIEIGPLEKELREKMLYDRSKGTFNIDKKTVDYIVSRTDGWTGAEIQELVNSCHLYFLNKKQKSKKIYIKMIDEIFERLSNFGVRAKTSKVGFGE